MRYIFEENQKFTQWWLWVILLSFPIISFSPFDEKDINYNHVLIGFALPLIFYLLQLRTKVNSEGLHYQFFPFHLKYHTIKTEEIVKIETLQYKPIAEYGGWGIRYGFKGKAYNTTGNLGVKVHLKNGRNILFGSQKHKDLAKALKQIKNK
tara:strand:- start:585 stop:1037 length:453 start_codon:yes stop_codon:yes gene_type:complete